MHYIEGSDRKRENDKGTDKHYIADPLIHSTTVHTRLDACTKFQNPTSSSS